MLCLNLITLGVSSRVESLLSVVLSSEASASPSADLVDDSRQRYINHSERPVC
jgi:hypothetical protein